MRNNQCIVVGGRAGAQRIRTFGADSRREHNTLLWQSAGKLLNFSSQTARRRARGRSRMQLSAAAAAPSPGDRLAGASRLEACDDLLLRIFAHLPILHRKRLTVTSRRWQRLLSPSEISGISGGLTSRAADIIRWAGSSLTSLDLSSMMALDLSADADAAIEAVCSACPNLRQLVLWDVAGARVPGDGHKLTSEAQVDKLARACPLLDDSTRLAVLARGAAAASRLLDAVPGRYAGHCKPLCLSLPSVLYHKRYLQTVGGRGGHLLR